MFKPNFFTLLTDIKVKVHDSCYLLSVKAQSYEINIAFRESG